MVVGSIEDEMVKLFIGAIIGWLAYGLLSGDLLLALIAVSSCITT